MGGRLSGEAIAAGEKLRKGLAWVGGGESRPNQELWDAIMAEKNERPHDLASSDLWEFKSALDRLLDPSCNGKIVEIDGKKYKLKEVR